MKEQTLLKKLADCTEKLTWLKEEMESIYTYGTMLQRKKFYDKMLVARIRGTSVIAIDLLEEIEASLNEEI